MKQQQVDHLENSYPVFTTIMGSNPKGEEVKLQLLKSGF